MTRQRKSPPPPVIEEWDVQEGDFVRSQMNPFCTGFVVKVGGVQMGSLFIPGVLVRLATGRQDFISMDDGVLIAREGDVLDCRPPDVA